MKKINNKGFALVETIVVASFVMGILMVLYTNSLPLMGEYEKRENYDNIDNVYKSYLIKRMIENSSSSITCNSSTVFKCTSISRSDSYCTELFDTLGVEKVYLAPYKITSFTGDEDIKKYVDNFKDSIISTNRNKCRIIVKYKTAINSGVGEYTYQYATIGVGSV